MISKIINNMTIYSDYIGPHVTTAGGLSAHYPLRYSRELYTKETSFSEDVNWAGMLDVVVNVDVDIDVPENPGTEGVKLFTDYSLSTAVLSAAGGADFDGDGMEEVYDVYSYYNGSYAYLCIDKYEYRGFGEVKHVYNLLDYVVSYASDIGDLDNDGDYEIAVGGYEYDVDSGELGGILYIADAETLDFILRFSYEPSIGDNVIVSNIATGDVDGDGALELIVGYNDMVYYSGVYYSVRGTIEASYLGNNRNLYIVDRVSIDGASIVSLTVGDIDSDGIDEIIFVSQSTTGQLELYVYKRINNTLSPMGQ